MNFYEVLVSSQRYHGSEPLTYKAETKLSRGQVVEVPFGNTTVLGITVRPVSQPSFEVKAVGKLISAPIPDQLLALHTWLTGYYPGPSGLITQLFLPSSLGEATRKKVTDEIAKKPPATLPPLSPEQRDALSTIEKQTGPYLLFGETGSGKTRLYIELAKQALDAKKSVLILTPEIGLTPQLIEQFETVYPGKVHTVHSTQTRAERRGSWSAINSADKPVIVIGPRSALFSPIHSIGLIVVDEAHDGAYKQENTPYYQTTRVAATLARIHDAKLILGTATPPISDFFTFEAKGLPIIRMEKLATGEISEVNVTIIDLKQREEFGRSPWLSNALLKSIEASLQDGYQSLLFLNRRGTARVVLCQKCGWQASCPRCDLPLTYHGDKHHLRCHTCGFSTTAPTTCPECKSAAIEFKSIGTKTIMSEVTRLFPTARIQRFDGDTKKSERLESQFESIQRGDIDILIGTQMLTKGLDLPRLQVVGVILADTGLYFPDYTAEERTFQMLRQVIGRVGRGHTKGQVFIQTYQPDSTPISAAANRQYTDFYAAQLAERELYHFPPYYFVLKISIERAVQSSASKTAQDIAAAVLQEGFRIELSGPAPAFVERTHNKFKWQIIIKAKRRSELLKIIAMLPKNCSYDIDPSHLL